MKSSMLELVLVSAFALALGIGVGRHANAQPTRNQKQSESRWFSAKPYWDYYYPLSAIAREQRATKII